MPLTNLEKAEADRSSLTDHLEFLETELTRHLTTPLVEAEVDMYLTELEETRKMLGPNHTQIHHAAPKSTDMSPYVAGYRKLSQLASKVYVGLLGIKKSFPSSASSTSATTSTSSSSSCIKYPRMELPKFSGNMEDWISFRDLFVTAIHSKSLTKVEKFTQLKTLLTGEAARQVKSLMISETNYDIAWDSLRERYENHRELLFSILKRLLNQPVITSGTAVNVRSLVDTTKECVRSLDNLSIPTDQWDAILLYLLFSKLDPTSRELWEQSLADTSIPDLQKMYEFLEQRARALAAGNVTGTRHHPKSQQQAQVRAHHLHTAPCNLGCSATHPLFRCEEFVRFTPQERFDAAKRLKVCHNCLNEGHMASSCPSKFNCKTCNRRHHTMIHLENRQSRNQHQPQPPAPAAPPAVQNHHVNPTGAVNTGILATARIRILTASGSDIRRSLIDPGSTNTYISERAAKLMNLPLKPCHIPMTGLAASSVGVAKYVTTISFSSHFNSFTTFSASALVVRSVSTIPSETLRKEDWNHLKNLQLADPEFHLPGPVDILLGTDVVWSILDNERIAGGAGEPYAVKSALGWLVAGPNISSSPVTVLTTNADLDATLRRFWEQEEVEERSIQSNEELACEQHFTSTHRRDSNGRFIVCLPLKTPLKELGSSRQAAVRRFLSLERKFTQPHNIRDAERLRKLNQHWSDYKDFMREYVHLGHMSLVPPEEINSSQPTYYIPHHSVIKESSTTTKLRVVFDASAATTNGTSLNDCQMIGPKLQDTIWDIMLRFRKHKIAFTADIAKMYRQILVTPEHTDLQRIVWREDLSQPLKEYRLLTVTYGTASAPYLAVKCLQQLAKDEEERFPDAAKVALTDFYVDDTASGADTLEKASSTVNQLMELCKAGGFELRKWTTNSKELLSSIPEDFRETKSLVEFQDKSTIKTLGVYWNPSADEYSFKLTLPPSVPGDYTKRIILSEIARIYDPLGWLAPTVITCKIFMQDLWKLKYGWDDKLPAFLQEKWVHIRDDLRGIEKIRIPRCVLPISHHRIILVGCSDASIKAISAAIFICSEDNDGVTSCHLLTSKTKVAPVKHVTLPRLELNGAVLLSELLQSTIKSLNLHFNEVRAFTDSTIALHWINSDPSRWKMYIRRRVQAIQENVPTAQWFHISGERNPADCASRGISSDDLQNHPMWWNGVKEFFKTNSILADLQDEEMEHLEKEAQVTVQHAQPSPLPSLLLKISGFNKLQRVVAYALRFINNCVRPRRQTPLQKGPLTVFEVKTAHNFILRSLQQSCFAMEYEVLETSRQLPKNSSLVKLQPFLASDGLIRVGGRLRHSNLPYHRKHPILLPKGHFITNNIIREIHLQNLHAGPSATLSILQQNYWITNGRDATRFIIRKCVSCARHKAELMSQVMGDLPYHRINPAPAFSKTGVDYAGPFTIRPMVRSKVTLKCWLAIFVCLTTKGIHIEVVSSLSTDCFLATLRRFIARRGKPTDIFSDCGTNFKGADKVLRDFFVISRQQVVQDECSSQQISWHFNPTGAPHFGGLWEAGVKSIKHHLVRVMGSSTFTYEEMLTLVTQIEGILNSRPIVPASADPSDLGALTPGHFIIGGPITAVPEPNLVDSRQNLLQRWQLLQQRTQQFWQRWSNEYLTRLQQRPKWMKTSSELQVGHLVLIKEERLPPLKWKLGRVIAVHPGKDGHVRVASLKTTDGECKRPVVKLSLLPINYE